MKNSNAISAKKVATILVAGFMTTAALAGLLDNAWLMGVTDKDPLTYKPGEEIVFTVTPKGLDGAVPDGKYFLEHLGTDLNIVGYKRFNHVARRRADGGLGAMPPVSKFLYFYMPNHHTWEPPLRLSALA